MGQLDELDGIVRKLRADFGRALVAQASLQALTDRLRTALNIDPALWAGNLAGLSGSPTLQEILDVVDAMTGGGGAPTDVEYLVGAADVALSAERVVTDTDSIAWDLATAGQAKANAQFGTTAGTVCEGDDTRLSNARTPTAHATSHEPSGGDAMTVDAAAGTGSLRTLGTGSTQAAAGNHSHSGYEPAWQKVKKTSDFSTTSTTPQRTGLAFTLSPGSAYRVSGEVLMRSSDTTTAPKLSFSWPSGMEDGSISIRQPNAVNVEAMRHIRIGDTTAVAITSLPTDANTYSYSCFIQGTIVCGGSASGDLEVMLSSEVSGNTVYVKKWSNLQIQEIV